MNDRNDEHPTEQFPAAGPQQPTKALRPATFGARRRLLLGAAAAVVIVVVGVTAWAFAASTHSADTPAPAQAQVASPSIPGKPHASHAHPVVGTIATENGNTWTLTTHKGATVTLTLTPTTSFGTRKAPLPPSQFAVGDTVAVIATPNTGASGTAAPQNAAVTATRITKHHLGNPTATPASTSSAPN